MLASSIRFLCRCVCQLSEAEGGSYYILFFWADACLLFVPLTGTLCSVFITCVPSLSLLIQLIGSYWRWLTFYFNFLTLLIHHFCKLHHLLFFFPDPLSYFSVDKSSFYQICLPSPSLLLFFPLTFLPPPPPPPLAHVDPQWLQGEVVELCARSDPMSSSTGAGHQGPSHQPPMTASSPLTNPPSLWYSFN